LIALALEVIVILYIANATVFNAKECFKGVTAKVHAIKMKTAGVLEINNYAKQKYVDVVRTVDLKLNNFN
jgi:hypothetical protein